MNKNISLHIRNIILWMLVIGYYFIIISFSATPADKSTAESQAVVDIVSKASNVVLNEAGGDASSWINGKTFHSLVRKTAHVFNFFILAFLHCMLFFSYSGKRMCAVLMTLCMGFCGAGIDELTQLFIDGRCARISDVFVDFTGTVLGCILFVFLYSISINRLERG